MLRDWVDARLPTASAWMPEQFDSRIEIGIAASMGEIAYRADRVARDEIGVAELRPDRG
jgi:hypothetical protein